MKKNFYLKGTINAICIALIAFSASVPVIGQVYTDTTGLIADLEAGIFEEYILAPVSVEDTFFIDKQVNISGSAIIKAKDDLGFKPVVTGGPNYPNFLFYFKNIVGGADFELEGIRFVGSVGAKKLIKVGTARIESENINFTAKNCDFLDYNGYNALVKYYNSGGNVTIDNVLVHNCGGKIIQVTAKDADNTVNYVPKIGDLTITNTTASTIYDRIFFELGSGSVRIDPEDPSITQTFNAGAKNITIDHCTFFNIIGVDWAQGRSKYELSGNMAAVEGTFSITNTIFAGLDQNLALDSAAQMILDYNYYDYGNTLASELKEDLEAKWSPTNTMTTAPVFADTANGAWDLTLQNEAEILGSDGKPIGDPRWWQEAWPKVSVKNLTTDGVARIYSYQDRVFINAEKSDIGSVYIFNITGQLVLKKNVNSSLTEIPMQQGLYLVRVKNETGTTIQKVLIGE